MIQVEGGRPGIPNQRNHMAKGVDGCMKFTFTDKKVTLPRSVHEYAEKKVGKLDRYFPAEAEATVVFSVEKGRNNAEVTVRDRGTIYRARQSTSDMFATIDAAVADIERQLRKNKARLEKRLRKDAFVRTAEETSFAPDEPEEEYQIIRSKRFAMKPMSPEEAVLQMNLLGHTFFAFRNEEEGEAFAVVYKRDDGGYGLIQDGD